MCIIGNHSTAMNNLYLKHRSIKQILYYNKTCTMLFGIKLYELSLKSVTNLEVSEQQTQE